MSIAVPGDTDEELYDDEIVYVNIPDGQEAYWTIPLDGKSIYVPGFPSILTMALL